MHIVKRRVLILGSRGFLGSYVAREFQGFFDVSTVNRALDNRFELHITEESFYFNQDFEGLEKIFLKTSPEIVINCAAITNIEVCESNLIEAERINTLLPSLIARLTHLRGIKFIHISTDAVYSPSDQPKTESDLTIPVSAYGKTKLWGEQNIQTLDSNALILRTNFIGHNPRGKSTFDFFLQNILQNKKVEGYENIIFNPIYVLELVKGIFDFCSNEISGIFNLCGEEIISKFDLGRKINDLLCPGRLLVKPTSYTNVFGGVTRQNNLVLANDKIRPYFSSSLSIDSSIVKAIEESESIYGRILL